MLLSWRIAKNITLMVDSSGKQRGPSFSRGTTRARWSIIRLCRAYRARHACPTCGKCGWTSRHSVIDKVLMMLRLRTGNAELYSVFSLTLDLHLVRWTRCIARADAQLNWHAPTTRQTFHICVYLQFCIVRLYRVIFSHKQFYGGVFTTRTNGVILLYLKSLKCT